MDPRMVFWLAFVIISWLGSIPLTIFLQEKVGYAERPLEGFPALNDESEEPKKVLGPSLFIGIGTIMIDMLVYVLVFQ